MSTHTSVDVVRGDYSHVIDFRFFVQMNKVSPDIKGPSLDKVISGIARYFRDFLETDFKRQRLPKRGIVRQDRDGNLVGIPLDRYQSLAREIWQVLTNPIGENSSFSIRRGRHRASLSKSVRELIELHTNAIDDASTNELIAELKNEAITLVDRYRDDPDHYHQAVIDRLRSGMIRHVVNPLLKKIEGTFNRIGDKPIETVFEIEDELSERLVSEAEGAIGEALNIGLVHGSFAELSAVLNDVIGTESIRARIWAYFETFASADVYNEILRIQSTLRFRDNFESYLYIGEIHFGNNAFPIFYFPIQVDLQGTTFRLSFDPHLFINKKAIDYVSQEVARQHGERAPTLVKDRILFLEPEHRPVQVMQGLLDKWMPSFQLTTAIDLSLEREQRAKSTFVTVTNRLNFSAFDKSDESLLNDYEALLMMTEGGEQVANVFRELVGSFLFEEPDGTIREEVDTEWSSTPISDRLVYRSPIPLNEEQRKILNALKKPNCKLIAVQGPPGTGKSHTITAIAFEAILGGKNILILSDKKEALDVAESKLVETLNAVRLEDEFQNPILRLGRQVNSYTKILRNQTIEKIRTYHRAAKSHEHEIEHEIERTEKDLKSKIEASVEAYESIEMPKLIEIQQEESKLSGLFGRNIEDALSDDIVVRTLEEIITLGEMIGAANGISIEALGFESDDGNKPDLDLLEAFLASIPAVRGFKLDGQHDQRALSFFRTICVDDIKNLMTFIDRYETIRWPIFGFVITRNKAREIDREFADRFSVVSRIDIHKRLSDLRTAVVVFDHLIVQLEGTNNCKKEFLPIAHRLLTAKEQNLKFDYIDALKRIATIRAGFEASNDIAAIFDLSPQNILGWSPNFSTASAERVRRLKQFIDNYAYIKRVFKKVPQFDYEGGRSRLESLNTKKLTSIMDERIIRFADQKRNTAREIRSIIQKKQKFPHDKFNALKNAFPCIIAGIRDFAEYVPLEPNLFDILIIDEASQVSISQAFPAMLRARKVVVLGDQNQFSNVKTSNASLAINQQYVGDLINVFRKEFEASANDLERVRMFNIKTSVLDFVDQHANFAIMLKKHFRGYPELIDFSSKYFYGHDLQAVKIRGKPIDEVIVFDEIEHDGKAEIFGNTNTLEAKFILDELRNLLHIPEPPSVGIVTPFTDQQKLISKMVYEDEDREKFLSDLKLKIMTFDSCQGEERDQIWYSLVATNENNKLSHIFPKDLEKAEDVETVLRLQRLNVGFSRAKEQTRFIHSMGISQLSGAFGIAVRHFNQVRDAALSAPSHDQVDSNSPMEVKLLDWLKQTRFFRDMGKSLRVTPQFKIGEYLKQLDPGYSHPLYRVDFLLQLKTEAGRIQNIILEYDGFKEHFDNLEEIDSSNYQYYYREGDIEREKILEGYGYKILRVNRFNLGKDPVTTLSERLYQLVRTLVAADVIPEILLTIEEKTKGLESGRMRQCNTCDETKPLEQFFDRTLKNGQGNYGRKCKDCKTLKKSKRRFERTLCIDKETRQELAVGINRKGAFLRLGQRYLSLKDDEEAISMTIEKAVKRLPELRKISPWRRPSWRRRRP